ncbi:hypothetical protein C8Q74DRAFT_899374 [Fomes fomentarius]|nr:hypothetical protein C8Q74DRAFT_899374 [Fomes fomentarius]
MSGRDHVRTTHDTSDSLTTKPLFLSASRTSSSPSVGTPQGMSANSPPVIPLRLPWTKAAVVLLVAVPLLGIVRAGNTTCISKQLDWYFDEVGESPCMTYQRLRQICNPDYQVTSFRSTSPGDQCDDVVSSCCCNSIAYALSMLCMNCLNDGDETNGIDAAPGGYRQYLGSCGPGTNQT